jgi:predicted AlkP superfamily phosphohydrolase/phosphomutase
MSTNKPKILVIGLDSVPAKLLFDGLGRELPNISKMIDNGMHAVLESCHPPITIPAWMVMMSGKSPGKLGIYGFRHRKGYSYNEGWIATSQSIKEPRVWDYLAQQGKKVCLVGVPPTYPPIPVNGNLVSCFITPKARQDFTYPPQLAVELRSLLDGDYIFDVAFRNDNRDQTIEALYKMTEKRFTAIKHLLKKQDWDFFMFVEIGVDRLHHMFWKYYDRDHPKYEPNNKYEHVIPQYYRYIDKQIGELLSIIDDDTYVLVVSDHGTASMKGAFCINEWLIEKGYLVLKKYPDSVTDLDKCEVDWDRTTAWGWGGYYARIFFNVKGRELHGKVEPSQFKQVREQLIAHLKAIKGPKDEILNNKIFTPEDLYDECNGAKPDLMAYFDDLYWRSAGTIGHKSLYLDENDTGPDDSVHWWDGVFILYNKKRKLSGVNGQVQRFSIYDIAPTILQFMGSEVPKDMKGRVLAEVMAQ